MDSSNNPSKVSFEVAGENLEIQIGKFAPQSSGSALLKYGQTVVLATVVVSKEPKEGATFLPLVVDYEERLYAAGKISSSRFIKREGRPSEGAILTGRLVDRSIRPLFPSSFYNDLQVILTVLSTDSKNDPDIVSILATSVALLTAKAPFEGPIGAVRVGRIDGQFIINPKYGAREKSDLDLVVVGTKDKIITLELEAQEIPEKDLLSAIEYAQKEIRKLIKIQEDFLSGKKGQKYQPQKLEINSKVEGEVKKFIAPHLEKAVFSSKLERDSQTKELKEKLTHYLEEKFGQEKGFEEIIAEADFIFSEEIKKLIREKILKEEKRIDGRDLDEIREINLEVGVLPRTHGSALFSRGYTQVLSIVTLGSTSAVQILEGIEPGTSKRFMHHYNFPPFSVGEISYLRAPSRREIGHGALAERALLSLIPSKETFPYTIRIVSEILSSDGSTSMASVCSSSLALMDAGVPISNHVAGISIGLVTEDLDPNPCLAGRQAKSQIPNPNYKILTDITGLEDFCGDMDFKIAGTKAGICAIQSDTKTKGLPLNIIKEALEKARSARLKILEKMEKTIKSSRAELSPYAPRIVTLKVNPEKIRDIIGPAGKTINKIISETGVEIDLEPDGTVHVSSTDAEQSKKAINWIEGLTAEAKVGEIYQGKVTKITPFGAFVEILPGQEGLVHISQFADYRIKNIEDIVKLGDTISVMVINIDEFGRISLSYKAVQGNLPK